MPSIRSPRAALARVAAFALMAAAVACGDPTREKATTAVVLAKFTLYPLTGAPPVVPTSLSLFGGTRRADASFNFDVAFDFDATGRILVYPVRALAGPLAGALPTRVGLQIVPGSFESLVAAPERGYDTITVRTVTPGTVFAAEVIDRSSAQCLYSLTGQSQFAKFVIDSVDASRRFHVRAASDFNCGYRSLVPDSIPTF